MAQARQFTEDYGLVGQERVSCPGAPRQINYLTLAGWLLFPAVALLAAVGATHLGLVLCPFRLVTHLPCPGCGMTRAMLELVQGHLYRALVIHPFSPFMAVILAGWWVNNLLEACNRPRYFRLPASITRFWWIALIAVLGVWVEKLR
jgi:hypothetical protein